MKNAVSDAGRDIRASRNLILRRKQGQEFFFCSADHNNQDWQPHPADAQFAESDDHAHPRPKVEEHSRNIIALVCTSVIAHIQSNRLVLSG